VKNKEEYYDLIPYLYPMDILDKEMLGYWSQKQNQGEMVVWITLEGFFWHPRSLLGIENHMYALYDMPDLIHEINKNILRYNLKMLDEICKICTPTFMTFAEDMSYNNGPMLSKKIFEGFLLPYYEQIVPELKRRGILSIVDSDGEVSELIPWLKEVGIEGILPLEHAAGVDVVAIRADHPKFKLIGAFDKTVMHLGEEEMRKEFERLMPVMKQGGFIPSVDHQTPPAVSLENYQCYVSLLKEYCIKAVQ
jgi:uroporphyrinogen-III decarboxylase